MLTELTREDIAMALESAAEVESIYKTIPQKDGSEICLLDRMESQNQGGGMQHLLISRILSPTDRLKSFSISISFSFAKIV